MSKKGASVLQKLHQKQAGISRRGGKNVPQMAAAADIASADAMEHRRK